MMSFSLASTAVEQIDQIVQDLHALEYRIFDLVPLAHRLAADVLTENMAARMLGVDAWGDPFAELSPNTWKRHPDRGPGPPLAPMDMASRVIGSLAYEVQSLGPGQVDVVFSWPDMPFLQYHVTGTRYMPRRNPVGIRPAAQPVLETTFSDWISEQLAEAS